MHIAVDVAQTAVERAGCGWYADGLARALARRPGVRVDLYASFGDWINASAAQATRAPGARLMLADASPETTRRTWKDAAQDGLPGRPSVVHAHSFQAPAVAGSKLVFTVHDLGFWTHPEFASEATRLHCQRGTLDALERAAGFVFVSQTARDEFETVLPGWFSSTGRPWTIIPGASRFDSAPGRQSVPSGEAPWLCVGSIEPRKNHLTLLDAYRRYRQAVDAPRPLQLVGGRGWCSDAIHARIAAEVAQGGVVFRGYISDEALAETYRTSFALVQPSWHEGFGLPVVEAGRFGLPVVCANVPALREVAGAGGLFFDPASAEELADAMIALHRDTALHARCSAASTENADRFSWNRSADRACQFYSSLGV